MKKWIYTLLIIIGGIGLSFVAHHSFNNHDELWGLELTGIEKVDLFELHNFSRAKNHVPLLEMHIDLDRCAQAHSEWMATHNKMSHEENTHEMKDVGDRLKKYRNWNAVGENIAYGQADPTEVTKDWMNSSGHRRNILSKNYKHIGFGIATSKTGEKYWCTVFSD